MTLAELLVVGGILGLIAADLINHGFQGSLQGRRLARNLGYAVAATLVALSLRIVSGLVAVWNPLGLHWPNLMVEAVVCVLVAEGFGWCVHYVKHVHPYLWRFHLQHHREEQYNMLLTTHTHALEVLVSGTGLAVLLALLGLQPAVVELYLLFYSLAKFFQHSSCNFSLGPLDRILVTPAYHRWHHEIGSHCNFGVCLTLFDVLLGTARWPQGEAPVRYGVRSSTAPYGFWAEHLWFLRPSSGQLAQRPDLPKSPL